MSDTPRSERTTQDRLSPVHGEDPRPQAGHDAGTAHRPDEIGLTRSREKREGAEMNRTKNHVFRFSFAPSRLRVTPLSVKRLP